MTMPRYTTIFSNGCYDKFIIIGDREIINLKYVSYIDIVYWDVVEQARLLRIVMNDGFSFELACNNDKEASEILFNIKHSIIFDKDKNIIEITGA